MHLFQASHCIYMAMKVHTCQNIFTVIRVGYEDARYAVRERSRNVELCVVTDELVPTDRPFVLSATLLDLSAGMSVVTCYIYICIHVFCGVVMSHFTVSKTM